MRLLTVFLFSMTLLFAAEQSKKKPAPPAVAIPSGAVKADDGSYRYTDAQGKKWIYRKTPFGVAKIEDKPVVEEPKADPSANVKAIEDGDVIRFERPGPFGLYKWARKKTELDEVERAAWERQKAAQKQEY